jgi:LmbE family N-acetylglucosaminyl deacetylase
MATILAFGAHPDDIEVGMGGTIKTFSQKNEVTLVIISIPDDDEVRRKEAAKAAETLGADLKILDVDPDKLSFDRRLVNKIDKVIRDGAPDFVFTHWNCDSHQDHVAVSCAVNAATRKNNCCVYMYEQTIPGGIVPFSFRAQSFVDISKAIDTKMASVKDHKSQVERNGDWWIHGIRGRATFRGYQINVNYAEAFEVVKERLIL